MATSSIKNDKTPHMGRNLQRVREIIGMKQDVMGMMTKSQYKQQTVSKWEQEETIPDNILDEFADVLGVTSEFIKKFNEEKSIFNIQNNHNTFNGNSKDQSHQQHYQPTINSNPTEQIAELFEKFFANDKERLDLISNLNKAVLELANEVKIMKEGK